MPKKDSGINLEFAFYQYLRNFYLENQHEIRRHLYQETKRFLDFNNPENGNAYLRLPQYEALEMYIFIKEILDNAPVYQIFDDWFAEKNKFKDRGHYGTLFGEIDKDQYKAIFERMKDFARGYPNYIFALTMGTGKTILMATCIFYEFILANRHIEDKRFCHNALVFAPDKTVLQSLKEIQDFDKSKVVPKEYVNKLNENLRFQFLDDVGAALNIIDKTRYNIIISNTQKIILKRQHKTKNAVTKLYDSSIRIFDANSVYEKNKDLYNVDDENELLENQRFTKLTRIEQLGIYVDEAHHAFGNNLSKDLGQEDKRTSLRLTIDELSERLKELGTQVVACYNYTGTPYVGNQVLPEVVYAYSLYEAIQKNFLKKVTIHDYKNTKNLAFVRSVLTDFWKNHKGKRYENMLPKIAFFASTIEELEKELKPNIEKAMQELKIKDDRLLVNVGDERITSNDDIREFNRLDTSGSKKQIILLVNKGKEGWNCRSLFGVALFREPKSKIFVLQASMRALRSITDIQETANIYLTEENMLILNRELEQNFRLDVSQIQNINKEKKSYQIHVIPPPVTLSIKRVKRLFNMKERITKDGADFGLSDLDLEKYKSIHTTSILTGTKKKIGEEDISNLGDTREFCEVSLVAEIARYFNKPCVELDDVLAASKDGIDQILVKVNAYNDILYDVIIPRLFEYFYEISDYRKEEDEEISLVREPEQGYYIREGKPDLVAECKSSDYKPYSDKSFHVDCYCFDSAPEKKYFDLILNDKQTSKVWFTGMFKHGESDFFVQYIDPDSHMLRSYYPDFLIQKSDESYNIVEIKADYMVDDPVIVAKKDAATRLATVNKMNYIVIKSSIVGKDDTKPDQIKSLFLNFVKDYTSGMFKKLLPVYSLEAACGKFGESQDIEPLGWVEVDGLKLSKDMFIIQATGKSMEPTIPDGAYCIFKANPVGSRNDKIILVQHRDITDTDIGGTYTIKKYKSEKVDLAGETWKHSNITLLPLNKAYQPIEFKDVSEDFENEFKVIGEFVKLYN